MARADQGPPATGGRVAITCVGRELSAQNGHTAESDVPGGSSPVITQERVIGSLRSSMQARKAPRVMHSQLRYNRGALRKWTRLPHKRPKLVLVRRCCGSTRP